MSPEFKPRHPGQRIGRRCQSGIIGLGDQYHDSALVRGYADVWVPPQGPGSWSADPTRGGDAIKVGENTQCPYLFGSRERKDIVANSPLNQPRVIVKAPLGSHMMMTHEAKLADRGKRSETPAPQANQSAGIEPPRSQSQLGSGRKFKTHKFDPRHELFADSSRS